VLPYAGIAAEGVFVEFWLVIGFIILAVFVVTFFSWRNNLGRKSREWEGNDPEMAKALRDAQNEIAKGRGYHF
jgi:hypothetical protein